jgi:hypothetical protein
MEGWVIDVISGNRQAGMNAQGRLIVTISSGIQQKWRDTLYFKGIIYTYKCKSSGLYK